jgi:hypothetical protein
LRLVQILLLLQLAGLRPFRLRVLSDPLGPLLHNQILFLGQRRVGVDGRLQVTVLAYQVSRYGTEGYVVFQSVEDRFVRKIGVGNELTMVCRVFGNPSLQLHHQAGVFMKDG